jgi:hypothetical protein
MLERRHGHILNVNHPASPGGSGAECPYCKFAADVREYFAA